MPDRTCSVDGCGKRLVARGVCSMHYYRLTHHGSLDLPAPRPRPDRTKRTCSIEGCDRAVWSREMCNLHYTRTKRTGGPGPAGPTTNPPGSGCLRPDGYRVVYFHGHPLADANGQILEHRLVLFAVIGSGEHSCHWCAKPIRWIAPAGTAAALVVDHLDWNRANNAPANLVPSCSPCNIARTQEAA